MRSLILPHPPHGYPQLDSVNRTVFQMILESVEPNASAATTITKRYLEVCDLPDESKKLLMMEMICEQNWLTTGQMKTVFPTAEIVRACKYTDLLNTVKTSDIKFPYPSVMFTLPLEEPLVSGDGRKLYHIIANFYQEQTASAVVGGANWELTFESCPYAMFTVLWPDHERQPSAIDLSHKNELVGSVLNEHMQLHRIVSTMTDSTPEQQKQEDLWGIKFVELALNMILVMQSYPEYVRVEETKMRMPGHKKAMKTTRLRLERTSNLRRTVVKRRKIPHEPTGEKRHVRPHWRIGHWRRQYHSERFEGFYPHVTVLIDEEGNHYHMKWIEPVFVSQAQGEESHAT